MARQINDLARIISDPRLRANLEARYWPKVEKTTPNECWPWLSKAHFNYGYGRMSFGRKIQLRAHRIAYALAYGIFPEEKCVLHKCDDPKCCNPKHLFIGTKADNTQDMMKKGRGSKPPHSFGEKHHNAKFDEKTAQTILQDERPSAVIAAELGVAYNTVHRIKNGDSWKGLPR